MASEDALIFLQTLEEKTPLLESTCFPKSCANFSIMLLKKRKALTRVLFILYNCFLYCPKYNLVELLQRRQTMYT